MARIYVPSTPASRGEVKGAQRGAVDRATGLSLEELQKAAEAAGFDLTPRASEPTVGADEPAGNASRDDWAAYARLKGATDADLVDKDGVDLKRDVLREKYGTPEK